MLTQSNINHISKEFEYEINKIFGENLLFAFIFGGVAKGYADSSHDIDMFICLKKIDNIQRDYFLEWYFDIHKRYNLVADQQDPGEIMSYEELIEKLEFLKSFRMSLKVESYYAYEAIVWGEILAGTVIASIGSLSTFKNIQKQCIDYPNIWRAQILNHLPDSPKIRNKSLIDLIVDHVTYLKNKNISAEVDLFKQKFV